MDAWDRSMLAMSASEHEMHEALRALQRLLEVRVVSPPVAEALRTAVRALQAEIR